MLKRKRLVATAHLGFEVEGEAGGVSTRTAALGLQGIGWIISIAGLALWGYGYLVIGHTPVVNWPALVPGWLAETMPNLEAEAGMVLLILGSLPLYWDLWRQSRSHGTR